MNKKPEQRNGLISIVIPIYNAGNYIDKTLTSLLDSSYKNIEVICVDDFSSDKSDEKILDYSRRDSRVKLVRRDAKGGNAGAGIAFGLPFCSGEWFFYLSQDDFISRDCLGNCIRRAEETDADIVVPEAEFYNGECTVGIRMKPPHEDFDLIMSAAEASQKAACYKISGFSLRRMDLVRKVGCESHFFDSCDKSTWIQYFNANKVAFCHGVVYYRQDNPEAITKKLRLSSFDTLKTINEFVAYVQKHGMEYRHIRKLVFYFIKARRRLESMVVRLGDRDFEQACHILQGSRRYLAGLALRHIDLPLLEKIFRPKFAMRRKCLRIGYWMSRKLCRSDFLCEFFEKKLMLVSNGLRRHEIVDFYTRSARRLECKVGLMTYSGPNVVVGSRDTEIGSFCSIAANVIIGAGEHPLHYASSSPFFYMASLGWTNTCRQEIYLKPCKIGHDVWIGDNVFVKGGVHIGTGAVVAAGAVVVKDVPPYAIVGGVPAKIIKYRFTQEKIDSLLSSKWWERDFETLKNVDVGDVDGMLAMLGAEEKRSE